MPSLFLLLAIVCMGKDMPGAILHLHPVQCSFLQHFHSFPRQLCLVPCGFCLHTLKEICDNSRKKTAFRAPLQGQHIILIKHFSKVVLAVQLIPCRQIPRLIWSIVLDEIQRKNMKKRKENVTRFCLHACLVFGACFLWINLDSVASSVRVKLSAVYIMLHIVLLVVLPP